MTDRAQDLPLRSIYGLTVASDIDLPELSVAPAGASPDIVIRRGDVPEVWRETDPRELRAILDGTPEQLWTRVTGSIRMIMREGSEITYALEAGCKEDEARLFLLGSGLGAILMQRGSLVIHGNAITLPGRKDAIVCVGDSGAGKSTTAIAMMQRGYSILADDICPIGPDGRTEPGMPRAKLWLDTAQRLGIDTGPLARIRDGDAKFNLPLGQRYCSERRSIGAFVWLDPHDAGDIRVTEVGGVEKFEVLRNNIYRPEFLALLGREADYLRAIARIAAQTPVYKVSRPRDGFDIDPLLDAIADLYASDETAHEYAASQQ